MGLAASQARLLTITARKSDCEFQSMSLSHQKIALARDMERISDEYQAAMNKTKIVYDYYGSGLSQQNLNYNLLMTPSVYNDYYPKLVTDTGNRIVLDSKYAAAARAAGIPAEGFLGTPSSVIRNAFIEGLCDAGAITPATAASVKSVTYHNGVGLGSFFNYTEATKEVTWDDLLQTIKNNTQDTSGYGFNDYLSDNPVGYYFIYDSTEGDSPMDVEERTQKHRIYGIGIRSGSDDKTYIQHVDPQYTSVFDDEGQGDRTVASRATAMSLYDLLKGDNQYDLTYTTWRGVVTPICEAAAYQKVMVGESEYDPCFLNWMADQFASVLGGSAANDNALAYAYDQVYDLIYVDSRLQDATTGLMDMYYRAENAKHYDGYIRATRSRRSCTESGVEAQIYDPSTDHFTKMGVTLHDLMCQIGTPLPADKYLDGSNEDSAWEYAEKVESTASDFIGMVFSDTDDGGRKNTSSLSVNLNNLAKVFLTAYKEYMEGIEDTTYSYKLGQSIEQKYSKNTKAALYNPDGDDLFTIPADGDLESSGVGQGMAGFYDTLFNMICTHGWTENDKAATDSDYLQEMMKSGAMFISSIDNDGYYYQKSYSTDTYISEVIDTEGIAQAEAKYNSEKSKIENKENRIDVKMKNLDSEISALTTEYDTVKGIITKSVEKSFKRYDA